MPRILLIEDEKNFSRFVELELTHENYSVSVAYNGNDGLQLGMSEEWDIILLDLMLPGLDGIEVCKKLRENKKTPILMLTARDSVDERVRGLDCGADDYLSKPFAIEELLARIRAILRRQEDNKKEESRRLMVLDLEVNLDSREVWRDGEPVELTKREYDLLLAFMNNPNRVMSRELLLDTVWGFEAAVDTNVVDVYVRYLRNKIDRSKAKSYIQTLRGVGYVMKR
ncbi:response regulator transcription factor [Alkalihalobacillus oceani]|uniref:response regulator transcription factor n=1 Tax=Halalkalibacter oceani TaxID=1653776 RepID=UPI00203B23A8|nr:response regulator transcription factor [Halalkalibacter oceani]